MKIPYTSLILFLLLGAGTSQALQQYQPMYRVEQPNNGSFYKGLGLGIATGVAATLITVGVILFARKKSSEPNESLFAFLSPSSERSFLYKAGEKREKTTSTESQQLHYSGTTGQGSSNRYYKDANRKLREAREGTN